MVANTIRKIWRRVKFYMSFFGSIFGSLTNLIGILIVIYRGLFRQRLFMFFVNFLVCNFLMCPVGLTIRAVLAFSSIAAMDSSTLRRV